MNDLTPTKSRSLSAGATIAGIIPRDITEAWRLSEAIVGAGMVPASYEVKAPPGMTDAEWMLSSEGHKAVTAKIMIGIMKGLEVGLPPITALSTIAVINNRPSIWGDGATALLQDSGRVEWMRERMEGRPLEDDWTAICEIKRKGQEEVYARTFSVADAKRGGLWGKKGPWVSYPQRMLQMRARSWAMRDGFADVLSGLSIAEEVQDIPQAEETRAVATDFLDDDGTTDASASAPRLEHQPVDHATVNLAEPQRHEALVEEREPAGAAPEMHRAAGPADSHPRDTQQTAKAPKPKGTPLATKDGVTHHDSVTEWVDAYSQELKTAAAAGMATRCVEANARTLSRVRQGADLDLEPLLDALQQEIDQALDAERA